MYSCADSHKGTFLKSKSKNHSSWHICTALSPNYQNINRKSKGSIMYLCDDFFILSRYDLLVNLKSAFNIDWAFSGFTSPSIYLSWCTTLLTTFATLLQMKTKLFQICLTIIDLPSSDLNKTVLNLIFLRQTICCQFFKSNGVKSTHYLWNIFLRV